MTFDEFERIAYEMFDEIPTEYREGLAGLVVKPEAPEHPELEEIWTLGECITEGAPVDFPGPDDLRSFVVLYHGSFERIAERSEDFDYETEIWNTITHEIRHHIEFRAEEDALEVQDYAEEQNFARRDGRPFDTFFFRTGVPHGPGAYEVDGDLFVEIPVDPRETAPGEVLPVRWNRGEESVPRPDRLGDVHFLTLDEHEWPRGDLVAVLARRRGPLDTLWRTFTGRPAEVHHSFLESC